MAPLTPGLYERLVDSQLAALLKSIASDLQGTAPANEAELADRAARYVKDEVQRALASVPQNHRATAIVEVVNGLMTRLHELVPFAEPTALKQPAQVLTAVHQRAPDGRPRVLAAPLTPLLDSTLLTNAPGEPNLWSQLRSEIESADSIDVVMAFIRRSGIRQLLDGLRQHCAAGRPLRVLTTTYTGSTERAALDELRALGADVRVSYDVSTTRLHAKAWVFSRNTGFSTIYVGSSNLTHSAQVAGMEWNVRASAVSNPALVDKFLAVFDSYWDRGDFRPYDPGEFDRETTVSARSDGDQVMLSPIELEAKPFQDRLLGLLALAREEGHHRNLLVAATGTGKTVMAALDYKRLRGQLPRARLLFVAHREEILEQARATFRYALRDRSFGEKWVGRDQPRHFDAVFASIQSLNANGLAALDPDHFDVVIVDEFHHAAAASYQRLLAHVRPVELLGLTATPERSDDLDVLGHFGGRIAAELRLWDAIDYQYLVPFFYYGLHDDVDLTDLPFKRGAGYDNTALTQRYVDTPGWADGVLQQLADHADVRSMRALGFCVSIEHARFMAQHFNAAGLPAVAVWGDSSREDREGALRELAAGHTRIVFSVDLFNEGVDVPDVDTILMLRPTESPVLFLQQLGRGLRRAPGKNGCTVLDFVGLHHKQFRYDRKFRALLGGTRAEVALQVQGQFPYLPAGCSLQLDPIASERVLKSIREALPSSWPAKTAELRSLLRSHPAPSLGTYLEATGLELEDVYDSDQHGWTALQRGAGMELPAAGPQNRPLHSAVGRLLHLDDHGRLDTYREILRRTHVPNISRLPDSEQRLLHMLVAQLADKAVQASADLQHAVDMLWQNPTVLIELQQLVDHLPTRIARVHAGWDARPSVPLRLHARYSRLEILAAVRHKNTARMTQWQSGVLNLPEQKTEMFAVTLDKSGRGFSPNTRYQDYAVSPSRFHWQSQAAVREDSRTGVRYRDQATNGYSFLLFVRLKPSDRAFWFLGPVHYVTHTGERPMSITWRLEHELPGDLYTSFAAAIG